MKKLMRILFGILLGVAIQLSVGCDNSSNPKVTVTLAEYNELTYGMSYDMVVAIVGRHEDRTTSVTAGPYADSGTVYRWDNRDGSVMLLTFVSTTLVAKAETNLQ